LRARSRKFSWYLTWAIIDIVVIAILSCFVLSLPIWRIHKVEVKGAVYIPQGKIKGLARVPMNENIFMLDPAEIKERFAKTVQIKDLHIKRKLPGTVVIEIKERRPFAIVNIGSTPAIMDNEGYIIAKSGLSSSIYRADLGKLPVIRGVGRNVLDKNGRLLPTETMFIDQTIILLSSFLDIGSVQIELSDRDNVSVYIEDILRVKIGNYDKIEKKIGVLKALLIPAKEKLEKVAYIDVRVPDDPVIRFR